MVVGAEVCELTDGFLWFVCGLYVGILTSPLTQYYEFIFWAEYVLLLLSQKYHSKPKTILISTPHLRTLKRN